ncbi:TPA: F protein, partial [Vibrio cholerae]
HQVYYKAGKPILSDVLKAQAVTQYAQTNADEWFAEHYVAWLFSPKALQQSKPDVYDFIQKVTESVR